jgi:excisionase family DNA binding protein
LAKFRPLPAGGKTMTPELGAKGAALIPEAQEFLRVSRTTLYGLMDNGELAYIKIGRSRRIPWAALVSLVEGRTTVTKRGPGRKSQ